MIASDKQKSILTELEPIIVQLTDNHTSKYSKLNKNLQNLLPETALINNESFEKSYDTGPRHWFPSQVLPSLDYEKSGDLEWVINLQKRAEKIPDDVRISLALNIITEEGLPHFHTILSKSVGENTALIDWTNLWTAEEETHGALLKQFANASKILNTLYLEKEKFEYLKEGFKPAWTGNPWKLFVYTSLQEMATKVSHENTGKIVEHIDPYFNELTKLVAQDEAKHYAFYMKLFKEIILRDPNDALKAAAELMPRIDMPAVAISEFPKYAEVIGRMQIYSFRKYIDIVNKLIISWGIDSDMRGLDDNGKRYQQDILELPGRLSKAADRFEKNRKSKSFTFPVIYDRTITLE